MAKKNNSARKHSSPGLYFSDTVVKYATKSLGITSLGVVGETLKGRAFEPTSISDWADYVNNFGGTSTVKYKGSKYPKYELPYIAQSYLEQSHNLKVVRVLGLSGVNAGPAWIITAEGATIGDTDTKNEYNNMVVLVIRSRGEHKKAAFVREANPSQGICDDVYEYDGIHYYAKEIELESSKTLNLGQDCNPGYNPETGDFNVDSLNYGTFTIKVTLNDEMANSEAPNYKYYSVTLNPSEKNYIYNVIGGEPDKGDAEIYVEELYDVALRQLVNEKKIVAINSTVVKYEPVSVVPEYEDVYDLLTDPLPSRKMLGRRYLYSNTRSVRDDGGKILVKYSDDKGMTWTESDGMNGMIYTVMTQIDSETGKRSYFYGAYVDSLEFNGYTELTTETEKAQTNGTAWLSYCEATPTNQMTIYGAEPSASKDSPIYIKVGSGSSKIVNETDGTVLNNDTNNQHTMCEYSAVSTLDGTDYLVIEYSAPSESVQTFSYTVNYNGNSIGNKTESGKWRSIVKLNTLTGWNSSYNGTDASLITIEYTNEKYYKKNVSFTDTTGDRNFDTERLLTYDYSTQVADDNQLTNCVRVVNDSSFYVNTTIDGVEDVYPITLDFNNYKERYRWASSPWIVSEMKGSAENIELNRLFRFHAISDGANSTTEFKVSIENIDPSTGKFDVVVRDYYDSDLSVNILERFNSCTMVSGSSNYIALKIGSTDGLYNSNSNYITVEVIENDVTKNSVPSGFLGYPIRNYNGFAITSYSGTAPVAPYFKYNTNIDEDIKAKKQYFGVSDLMGIDDDIFKYKGIEAYDGNPEGLTPCFHLDARILNGKPDSDGKITQDGIEQIVSVDGITGYTWVTVNKNNTTSYGIEPRIGDDATMYGTIYEDKAYRKFTVAMYGGWDGWDYYRTVRSNGDEFSYKEYKGAIDLTSGYGTMFSVEKNPESIGFNTGDKVITSDYYAYLAGVKQLGNPKSITVNVLATPGIDYVNNKSLVDNVIDIVEDDRGDLIYVITTPDKPAGSGDSEDEMYSADDAVYNLEDSDIDSNHCCTYYPWVKYYDKDNYQYVYLPLTRDVVKSIAYTDNVKFSWYANAGWNRGNIPDNASPKKKLTLSEQDTLYNGRINFVNSFAEEGNKIWGDKNLQIDDNLLNRISKRRLLLRIRTMLQNACIGLIFEPNDNTISQTVRSAVSKVLDDVKTGRGISDYKIDIDDSPETRDQLGLNVTYHIKPIQALEWINFTSVLTPEGMQWT